MKNQQASAMRAFFISLFLLISSLAFSQYFYDGSGKQVARFDGNYIYNASGHQIGRIDADGLRRMQVIIFFYYFY